MRRNGVLAEIDMTLHRDPESSREPNHIAAATSRRMSQFTHELPGCRPTSCVWAGVRGPDGYAPGAPGPAWARAAPRHASSGARSSTTPTVAPVGEKRAAEALRRGAADYVHKSDPPRLALSQAGSDFEQWQGPAAADSGSQYRASRPENRAVMIAMIALARSYGLRTAADDGSRPVRRPAIHPRKSPDEARTAGRRRPPRYRFGSHKLCRAR